MFRFLKSYHLIIMKNKQKVKFAQDYQKKDKVSPSFLQQNIIKDTPEQLTFQPVLNTETHSDITSLNNFPAEETSSLHHFTVPQTKTAKTFQNKVELTDKSNLNRMVSMPVSRRPIRTSLIKRMGQHTKQQQLQMDRQVTKMKNASKLKKTDTSKIIFEKNNTLELIVKSQKINNIKNNFIRKVTRTSTSHPPVDYTQFSDWDKTTFLNYRGIQLPPLVDSLFNFLSVIQISVLLVVYSISLTFQDLVRSSNALTTLQIGSLVFYFVQIMLNFITVKSQSGKKVDIFKQIFNFYVTKHFWIDIVSLIILLLDILTNTTIVAYLRLFIIFKLPQCLHKIQKIEVYLIRNVYNQQYWELAKVFLVNFCYAHLIALFLAAMANLSPSNSWMTVKNIEHSNWPVQYIWSYYWAVNIMLTVGFGDIVANNTIEAVCLIFIQTFSCIMMAYNVNCVGTIISNIRSEDQLRNKKFKIFKKLADQNYVPEDLLFKISNYIEESSNLRKKYSQEEEKEFVEELPVALKVSYLREANKKVLKKLVFFRGLLERTLCNFAERIQSKIAHPQETIRAIDDDFNLIILKLGQIGYACKKSGCGFNEEIADLIKINEGDEPYLTSLDFISKQRPLYEIKSLQFSVIYKLPYNQFIEIFRTTDMDYELYCLLRDKIRNIPDEFEVHPCQFCIKFNHFKFSCPRLHYAPLQQHIINKELYREKIGRNDRQQFIRDKTYTFTPVQYFKKIKDYRQIAHLQIPRQRQRRRNNGPRSYTKTSFGSTSFKEQIVTNDLLQDVVNAKTRQILQMEFVQRERIHNFEDDIWGVSTDVMENFNSYFSSDNPRSLSDKFSPENRKSRKIDKADWHHADFEHISEEISKEINESGRSLFLAQQFGTSFRVSLKQYQQK